MYRLTLGMTDGNDFSDSVVALVFISVQSKHVSVALQVTLALLFCHHILHAAATSRMGADALDAHNKIAGTSSR